MQYKKQTNNDNKILKIIWQNKTYACKVLSTINQLSKIEIFIQKNQVIEKHITQKKRQKNSSYKTVFISTFPHLLYSFPCFFYFLSHSFFFVCCYVITFFLPLSLCLFPSIYTLVLFFSLYLCFTCCVFRVSDKSQLLI